MMFKTSIFTVLVAMVVLMSNNNNNAALAAVEGAVDAAVGDEFIVERRARKSSNGSMKKKELTITVTNLSFAQPFSPMFVMVHNSKPAPLFQLGMKASGALGTLAERGDPDPLVTMYKQMKGVAYAGRTDAPLDPGMSTQIKVTLMGDAQYVTIATMAVNTNDCFVALNGVKVDKGDVITGVGYDSGTEINNEMCSSIPGLSCAAGNSDDGMGEGFVHVHRGIQAIGDLPNPGNYDWRNPMVRFYVS